MKESLTQFHIYRTSVKHYSYGVLVFVIEKFLLLECGIFLSLVAAQCYSYSQCRKDFYFFYNKPSSGSHLMFTVPVYLRVLAKKLFVP